MLDNFPINVRAPEHETQRKIVAMAAALEIAKASAGAATHKTHSDKVADDLKYASQHIEELANVILNYVSK